MLCTANSFLSCSADTADVRCGWSSKMEECHYQTDERKKISGHMAAQELVRMVFSIWARKRLTGVCPVFSLPPRSLFPVSSKNVPPYTTHPSTRIRILPTPTPQPLLHLHLTPLERERENTKYGTPLNPSCSLSDSLSPFHFESPDKWVD